MSTTPAGSLGPQPASIDARYGDAATDYVLVPRRDLMAVGQDRAVKTARDPISVGATTPSEVKSPPAVSNAKVMGSSIPIKLKAVATATSARASVMRGFGRKSVNTRLTMAVSTAGGVGANYSTVIPLEPSATSEWTAFSGLFDEVKVTSAELHYRYDMVTAGISGASPAVVVYDPLNSTALGSVVSGCEFKQHQLTASGLGAALGGPTATTKSGFHIFKVKILKGSARTSGASTVFGDEWSSCADAADTFGWIKPYIDNGGSASQVSFFAILYLNVSFRSRA